MTDYVLEILDGDRAGETVPLGPDRVTLGRKPQNTVQLADEKVSGQHAEIVFEDGRHVLRDLGSTNGTLLDGRRVDEVALTSFDTFQVGRVRVLFKEAGAEAPADLLKVHRIDQNLVARSTRRRGALGMTVAVVLLAAAGAWLYWQRTQAAGGGQGAGHGKHAPLKVAGNLLPEGSGDCEEGDRWQLDVSGGSFDLLGPAHTGSQALVASRVGSDDDDYILARLSDPVSVLAGQPLQLSGWLRCTAGGRGVLRLRFSSERGGTVLTYGTAPVSPDSYQEQKLSVTVPPFTDAVQVEVLALLPAEGAEVAADDVVLLRSGAGGGFDLRAGGCNLFGGCGGASIRTADSEIVSAVLPRVTPGLQGLAAAGALCVTDAGEQLAATGDEHGFGLRLEGGTGLTLVFPWSQVAGGVQVRIGDDAFERRGSEFEVECRELVLGTGGGRLAVRLPAAARVVGKRAGDAFRLTLPEATEARLETVFSAESAAASEMLQQARTAREGGEPGKALDLLHDVLHRYPYDDRLTGEAARAVAEINAEVRGRVDHLREVFAQAEFFGVRGAYERLLGDIDALVAAYGGRDMPERDAVDRMRKAVEKALAAFDAEHAAEKRAQLQMLVDVFGTSGDKDLEDLVKRYIGRHFGN